MIRNEETPLCEECEERLVLVRDYGARGQAWECRICGLYIEDIDLRDTKLSSF